MKRTILILAGGAAAALSACTPQATPSSFSRDEAMRVMPVQFGEIVAISAVEIRPGQTRLGALTGGVLGATGGSLIGRSTAANIAGGVSGAVVGGAIGSALQGSSRTRGVQLTVELESGETVAVVQPGNPHDYRVGDRVKLTGSEDNARVTRARS